MTNKSLSEILKLQQKFQQLDWHTPFEQAAVESTALLKLMHHNSDNQEIQAFKKDLGQLENLVRRIDRRAKQFEKTLEDQRRRSKLDLLKASDANFDFDLTESRVLERAAAWRTSKEVKDEIGGLLGQYVDWRFPVLYLEPNIAELTRYIVSGEPFYIVDDWEASIDQVVQQLTPEMFNKLHCYTKNSAIEYIPDDSIGLAVTWNNFRFKRINSIAADIELMSRKLLPGGIMLFDFNNGDTIQGAQDAELNLLSFAWQERIERFVANNKLEILHHKHMPDYHNSFMIVRKAGELPKLPLVNKLALVIKDQNEVSRLREEERQLREFYQNLENTEQKENQARAERDQKLNELEKIRSIDHKQILQAKMERGLQHLQVMLNQHGRKHIATVQAMINVAILALLLEKPRDAKQIHQQVSRLIKHLDKTDALVQSSKRLDEMIQNLNK